MKRRIAAALCSAIFASMAASALAIAQQQAGMGKERQVRSTIKDLMEAIIDPSADVIWGATGTIVDKDQGTIERFPKTPEEWTDVRRASVRIIEGANLLMVPGRETAPPRTKSATPGVELEPAAITALIGRNRTGFDGLRASEAKDAAALLDIGGRIQDVCEGCHQTFWYPH
jgi:hypothetical protein